MAASKKKPKIKDVPSARSVGRREDPDGYFSLYPSWRFSSCDREEWRIEDAPEVFFDKVLPYLKGIETLRWKEVMQSEKQNHLIDPADLQKKAQRRLLALRVEAESIMSLRVQATYRLYGLIDPYGVFNVLWLDLYHGDNDRCVCRSHLKHT